MKEFFGFKLREINEPVWKEYLRKSPEHIIRETGLSRERLEQVLEILYDNHIIH